MTYFDSWKDFHKKKANLLSEINNRIISLKFDSYEDTEKSWKIIIGECTYFFPKSKTILFKENSTIDVPNWLYVNNLKENDNKKF